MPFIRYVLTLLKLTALAGVAIVCACVLFVVVSLAVSPTYRANTLELFGFDDAADALRGPRRALSVEQQDFLSVVPDHRAIADWIKYCIGVKPGDRFFAVEAEFIPPSQSFYGILPSDEKWPSQIKPPNRVEKAIIQLSDDLTDQRIQLIAKVRSTHFFWEIATLVTIMIGMITTILVSVSSTEFGRGDGMKQRLIRVLAIVFPALGTAAAAVISFYSPQAEYGQASRTLASVTQLHDQIALTVWKLGCPPETDDGKSSTDNIGDWLKHYDDWEKRYNDIQTVANGSTAPDGNRPGGREPGGKEPSGKEPNGNPSGVNQGTPAASGSKPP